MSYQVCYRLPYSSVFGNFRSVKVSKYLTLLLQSFQAVRKMEQLQVSNILDVTFVPNLNLRYLMLVKLQLDF